MNQSADCSQAVCGGCPIKRRKFLAGCAACVAGASGLGGLLAKSAPAGEGAAKARVRLVFTHIPSTGPIWPNIGYDFDTRKKELAGKLAAACPNIEFVQVTAQNNNDAKKILGAADAVDGYLVYMVGLWTGAPQVFAASGKPVVYVDDLYCGSGEFLIDYAAARRSNQKVVGVSTSRFEDVARVAKCFELLKKTGASVDDFMAAGKAAAREGFKAAGNLECPADEVKAIEPAACLEKLRGSKILVVGAGPGGTAKAIEAVFGTKVLFLDFKELHEAHAKADPEEAAKLGERWIAGAEKVIEPSKAEVVNSAGMYLAERELLKRYEAQAITINCLGGFYGGHIKGYPCLGFCQLNDDGLVGACEADLHSTITMLALTCLTGRPGFISDPVIDTSKNEIIYAHCVAPTKVFGPKGSSNPYHIRSHSEDRKGASLRSLLPLGRMTTTLKLHPERKEVIFHQGKSVENVDEDKACRTKLAVEVKGDIDKLLTQWDRWSWHRVTFYGDLKSQVQDFCKAAGFSLVEEA